MGEGRERELSDKGGEGAGERRERGRVAGRRKDGGGHETKSD